MLVSHETTSSTTGQSGICFGVTPPAANEGDKVKLTHGSRTDREGSLRYRFRSAPSCRHAPPRETREVHTGLCSGALGQSLRLTNISHVVGVPKQERGSGAIAPQP